MNRTKPHNIKWTRIIIVMRMNEFLGATHLTGLRNEFPAPDSPCNSIVYAIKIRIPFPGSKNNLGPQFDSVR